MQDQYKIRILRGGASVPSPVYAKVVRCTSEFELERVNQEWQSEYELIHHKYLQQNKDIQQESGHWDWAQKWHYYKNSAFYKVLVSEKIEGMLVVTKDVPARSPETCSRKLLYVEYVAAAPQNIQALVTPVGIGFKFKGVGAALIKLSVQMSIESDYCG